MGINMCMYPMCPANVGNLSAPEKKRDGVFIHVPHTHTHTLATLLNGTNIFFYISI